MQERSIRIERAQNLWSSFVRKIEPLARGTQIIPDPKRGFDTVGGLAGPKDELLTYSCAATSPDVYSKWGTFPPSGVLMIGTPGCGKTRLAEALACHAETPFIRVDVPRMVLDMLHGSAKVGELIQSWSQVLEEMPPLTLLFDELEFSQAHDIGGTRPDLPLGPIMDFLLELIDRAIAPKLHLVIGSTGYPDTLRHAFAKPGRLERVIEVMPIFPDDIIEALQIHATEAEKRAGRQLFEPIDWKHVVGQSRETPTGEWVRILHAVLRRKARCEVSGDEVELVNSHDFEAEVARFNKAQQHILRTNGGNYL